MFCVCMRRGRSISPSLSMWCSMERRCFSSLRGMGRERWWPCWGRGERGNEYTVICVPTWMGLFYAHRDHLMYPQRPGKIEGRWTRPCLCMRRGRSRVWYGICIAFTFVAVTIIVMYFFNFWLGCFIHLNFRR